MKLSFPLFVLYLFTAYACHTSVRKTGVQGDTAPQANPSAVKRIRHNNEIDSVILPVWSSFVVVVKERNFQKLKRKSMDSIETCDSVYATSHFFTKCFRGIFDSTLLSKITDSTAIEFVDRPEDWSSFTPAVQKIAIATEDAIILKEIVVTKVAEEPDGPWMITFDFIPTHKGYLFYGCNSYGGPICCR